MTDSEMKHTGGFRDPGLIAADTRDGRTVNPGSLDLIESLRRERDDLKQRLEAAEGKLTTLSTIFGLTPAQYHGGLDKLWNALKLLGVSGVQDEDVFTLCARHLIRLETAEKVVKATRKAQNTLMLKELWQALDAYDATEESGK